MGDLRDCRRGKPAVVLALSDPEPGQDTRLLVWVVGQQGIELFDSSIAKFKLKVLRPRRLRASNAIGELNQFAHGGYFTQIRQLAIGLAVIEQLLGPDPEFVTPKWDI